MSTRDPFSSVRDVGCGQDPNETSVVTPLPPTTTSTTTTTTSTLPPTTTTSTTAPPPTTTITTPTTSTTLACAATESVATVTDPVVTPGQTVGISDGCFAPDQLLDITFESTPVALGTTRSDAAGFYDTNLVIPLDAEPGPHRIVVTGPAPGGGTHVSVGRVVVEMPIPPAPSGIRQAPRRPLALTGSHPAVLVAMAMLFAVAGSLVVTVSQQRRSAGRRLP